MCRQHLNCVLCATVNWIFAVRLLFPLLDEDAAPEARTPSRNVLLACTPHFMDVCYVCAYVCASVNNQNECSTRELNLCICSIAGWTRAAGVGFPWSNNSHWQGRRMWPMLLPHTMTLILAAPVRFLTCSSKFTCSTCYSICIHSWIMHRRNATPMQPSHRVACNVSYGIYLPIDSDSNGLQMKNL